MKKTFLTLALLFTMLIPQVKADTTQYATVFNIYTGVRKVVTVGDQTAFNGNYVLETKTQNLISYWQTKLNANNMSQAEIYKIPEIFWQTITPQIIKIIPKDGEVGSIGEKTITCKGKECDKYLKAEAPLGFTVVSNYKTTLSRSISSTASTIYVSSLTTKDNHVLTMADLGTKAFFTLEPGSNKEEIVMATGVGTLSWTSVTRGLSFSGTSTAAVTANQKSHSAGSAIVMSNVHYVYDELVDKDTADTIDGLKTYSTYPRIQTYAAPTVDEQMAVKKYVDDVALQSAPDATATVKGVTELATGAEAAAGATAGGTTGGLVLPASLATTTANVAGNHVAITDTDGKLKQDLLDLTEDFTFSGDNTFATSTFNSLTSASSTFTGITIGATNFWGNGADGASTTAASVSLVRDMYFTDLTINNGITLNPNGFRIFISGTLNTVGTGKIASNGNVGGTGNAGDTSSGGTGGAAGTVAYSAGTLPIPLAGKVGGAASAAATAGTNQAKSLGNTDATAGGKGGDGTGGSGGATAAAGTKTGAIYAYPYSFLPAYNLFDFTGTTATQFGVAPSGSSGSGGGGNTNCGASGYCGNGGGGSGSSGGVVWIAVRNITNLNAEAVGGTGGNGGTNSQAGVGGGGAGGNGGAIIIMYGQSTTITTSVAGGSGGLKGVGGQTTNATDGAAGNAGVVYTIQL